MSLTIECISLTNSCSQSAKDDEQGVEKCIERVRKSSKFKSYIGLLSCGYNISSRYP